MTDTIYALSTPFLKSAIAIVRVSGIHAKDSLKKLTNLKKIANSQIKLCTLYNLAGEIIDKPLVAYFAEGKSYTNEDLVEYHIHGSIAVIKELLDVLAKMPNHRLAYQGEFTKRALENGKISLIEAEGILDLINAETILQKQQALRILTGKIEIKYIEILSSIKENLALIETTIDFSDQEIPDNLLNDIDQTILQLKNNITKEINNYSGTTKLKHGINLTIAGVPNVGKSSLINYLSNSDVAIISNIAGTTRDIISSYVDIFGYPIVINDTAGIRLTNNEIEQEGIKRAIAKIQEADLRLIMIDANDLENSIKQVQEYIKGNYIIIVNKIDLLNNGNEMFHVKHFQENLSKKIATMLNVTEINSENIIFISIATQDNVKHLIDLLKNKFINITKINDHPIIINERHKNILNQLITNLDSFLINEDIIIKAHYLRVSMNLVGQIVGLNNIEDILDIIFSKFCIGK